MKAIYKHGPFLIAETLKVIGRPISVGTQNDQLFVWTEVDPSWIFLPNTKESDAKVEWHTLKFIGTGVEYEGKYIGTVHTIASNGYPYVWHCIEVE